MRRRWKDHIVCVLLLLFMYMGGISRDVKGKKSGMFTLYSLGFLDHYIFADLIKNYHVFEAARSEVYYVMG